MNPFRSVDGDQNPSQDELQGSSSRVEQMEHQDADDQQKRLNTFSCDSRVLQEQRMNIYCYEDIMMDNEELSPVHHHHHQKQALVLRVPPLRHRRLHGRRPYDRSPVQDGGCPEGATQDPTASRNSKLTMKEGTSKD